MNRVNNREYNVRPARDSDNFTHIASLIYATDPYIYPFWFGSRDRAIMPLHQLIRTPGTIFSRENIFVIEELWKAKILGVIVAISARSDLSYDYSALKATDERYQFAIEHYVEPSVRQAQKMDASTITVLDCCVAANERGQGLGRLLLGDFMSTMQKRGFAKCELDCLADNEPALALYHGLGFQEIKRGIGFDGTTHSQVRIVSLARQF